MRLEDVDPHMKVECISPGLTHISKGEVAKVISINNLDRTIDIRGFLGHYHPSHFKPYHEYSVGEEVVDFERTGKLVEIWAVHKKGIYAIMYENDEGNLEFDVRFEEELKHKKEKDELEVGINLFLIFIMENTKQYLYIIMTI
jgi:hypothetical protein